MARQFDLRNAVTATTGTPAARGLELDSRAAAISSGLPGSAQIRVSKVDTATSNAAEIQASGFDSGSGSVLDRALGYLSTVSGVLGFEPGQTPEYVANPQPVTTSAGAQSVYAQQMFRGIPIFQATQTVIFGPAGALEKSTGVSVGIPANAAFQVPAVSVPDAVKAAAIYLATHPEDVEKDVYGNAATATLPAMDSVIFKLAAQFTDRADLPSVVEPGPFANYILASLSWFPVGGSLRPSWQIVVEMPESAGQYRLLVDASSGDVLYCAEVSRSVLAKGQVYPVDGSGARQEVPFPLPVSSYGVSVPSGLSPSFPYPWVTTAASDGTTVIAHSGDSDPPLQGISDGQMLVFSPSDPLGIEQAVVNGFYYNCFMHDFLYLLGFREADGNFQTDNFGLGGVASDRVEVSVYPGEVWATANMTTPADGSSPTMKLGIVTSTGRHSAFDASVVFHEATHGLTSRLVGGALDTRSLEAPQSAGMSEGWSDFFACQILGTDVVGAWVIGQPAGVRGFPYDDNFPATFADLGKDRYTEMHAIGEIWCAVLMAVARLIGKENALRIVVDSLKLMPSNPSFLDARDAMLLAVQHEGAAGTGTDAATVTVRQNAIWSAFGRAGMGPAARCDGATLNNVGADFSGAAGPSAGTGTGASSGGWQRMGPAGTVPPGAAIAAAAAGGTTGLYVVGSDGFIYAASQSGSSAWSDWQRTGPSGTVPPAASLAVAVVAGASAFYVVGGDGFIYATSQSGSSAVWSGWQRTGPSGTVPPAASLAVAVVAGAPALYVVGGDGLIYSGRASGSSAVWSGWQRTGPSGTVPPAASLAVAVVAGASVFYVVGGDGFIYATNQSGSSTVWSGWQRTGLSGTVPPATSLAVAGTTPRAYVVGTDGFIYAADLADA